MQKNLVPLDRAVRLGAGLFLLATPLLNLPTFPFNLIGLVLLATAFVGFCPAYRLFGIGRRRETNRDAPSGGLPAH